MTYHQNGKLVGIGETGASGGGSAGGDGEMQNIAKKCAANLKFSSKEEREKAFKSTAKCAADAACAYFSGGSVPPGVCSSVVGPVADFAIGAWNDMFGNQDEWDEYYKQRQQTAAYFAGLYKAFDLDGVQGLALTEATNRIIEFHDKVLPSQAGKMGYGRVEQPGKTPPLYYSNSQGAARALEKAGAAIYPSPHASDPKDPPWYPMDNIGATYQDIVDSKGKTSGASWLKGQALQIVNLFLNGLQKAEAQVLLEVQAMAAAMAAAEGNTQVLMDGAKKARTRRLSRGMLYAGVGAAAGVGIFMWRRR